MVVEMQQKKLTYEISLMKNSLQVECILILEEGEPGGGGAGTLTIL